MLRINKNTEIFEAISEVDGVTVMVFKAEVDKENPVDSSLDVKKESEQLYRQYRDVASADRAEFEDYIFGMIDELEKIIDGEVREIADEDVPNFTGDDDDQEYHGEWSSVPIPDSTRDEKIRQECTEEEMTDGTYDCISAGR